MVTNVYLALGISQADAQQLHINFSFRLYAISPDSRLWLKLQIINTTFQAI